jgi:hypothetical protein
VLGASRAWSPSLHRWTASRARGGALALCASSPAPPARAAC